MRLELHPEARLEFLDAVAHYESCHSGLGERFIQIINSALASISVNPKAWAEIEQDIRRKLTRVFPYALLYTIEPDFILCCGCYALSSSARVLALASARRLTRRSSGRLRRRLALLQGLRQLYNRHVFLFHRHFPLCKAGVKAEGSRLGSDTGLNCKPVHSVVTSNGFPDFTTP